MNKHTPGPWEWKQHHGDYYSLESPTGEEVADDGSACGEYGGWMSSPDEPNARLIAAAPDLLAALQEFERYQSPMITSSYGREVIGRVRAAIAKATGE